MKCITLFFSAFFVALMLITASGCAPMPLQKYGSTDAHVDDNAITTRIKAKLFDEPNLSTSRIVVQTVNGIVQLSGFVNSQANIYRAADIARSVTGVKSVKNNIRLR